jgi:hypothetical protein
MLINCKTYWLPKDGNNIDDYEDAASPESVTDATMQRFDCAIADGATESSFSGLWARILVEGLRQESDIRKLRKRFLACVENKSLEWYAEEKLLEGAFAAVAILSITEEGEAQGSWSVQAIGDCCVMHIREEGLVTSFPIDDPEAFNNSPVLLTSSMHAPRQEDSFKKTAQKWCAGDKFWLMTDALACWTLKRHRDYGDSLPMLETIKSIDSLRELVKAQRAILDDDGRPYLKNDDVTLMKVSVAV